MSKLRTFLSQNFKRPITNRFVKPEMTKEAQEFLSSYKKWLNNAINEANLEQTSYTNLPTKQFLKKISPFINEMSIKQDKEGKKELGLYLPIHTMLYLICKKIKPEKVVETGVEKGGSTYMILKALHENNKGKLWSIDIGKFFAYNRKFVAPIGPLVEDNLKSQWEFVCGNAQKILGSTFKKVGKVDLFMAGQGHTYKVQKHEGDAGWKYLKNGGIFLLDRPDWNDGKYFTEFLEQNKDQIEFYKTYKEGRASDSLEFTVILKK